jgi:hypothetical protein
MRLLLLILLGTIGFHAQFAPPDSLTSKVVIFKDGQDLHIGTSMSWGSPHATGFYLDTGDVKCAFVVTARHVLRLSEPVNGLHLHIADASGRAVDEYMGDYRWSPDVLSHPDFWVDVALVNNRHPAPKDGAISGFHASSIVTREELQQLRPGGRAFYIGMNLDSIKAAHNVYSTPEGSWLETYETGRLIVDTTRLLAWKADFAIKIHGAPGVSGSPVLVEDSTGYRLAGIVNGFGVDDRGRLVDTAYCTAAYRILEALADTCKHGWALKGGYRG